MLDGYAEWASAAGGGSIAPNAPEHFLFPRAAQQQPWDDEPQFRIGADVDRRLHHPSRIMFGDTTN